MNLEGRLIGNRYEIIEKIGVGGMATVYKAKCQVLNRYVAIKILKEEFITDSEFVKRFNAEAQSVASLTHPNIVSIYDVGHEGNLYYIVMELVQGKILKDIIVEEGKLSWKWSINIGIQIASALETAHKNNIIHRDIKPHNIIITEDGIAKVADFGIAKAVSNSTITAFGTTIGSVHYFSPEHARGGYTDAKSDLYSLGVVLYEMVTGKLPFDADTPVSVALKHIQEVPIQPIKINSIIPISVNNIIMKAMQKDPELRYASATEMLKDLNKALKTPDENFVVLDFAETQKVPVYLNQETRNTENKDKNKKKNSKIKEFFTKHKIVRILLLVIVLIAIFVGTLFTTFFIIQSGKPKQTLIPSLAGLSLEEAKAKAEEAKLVLEVLEEFDIEIPANEVISQEPKYQSNYKILQGSTVKIVVSLGQNIVKVPKLVGTTEEEAREAINEMDFKLDIEKEASEKIEAGYIIRQEPEENTEVLAGSRITIYVSTGIEQVTVPNLIGQSEEDAKKAITEAKLKLVTVATTEDTTKENGVIIKQTLEAGSTVDKDSEITITLNKIAEIKYGTVKINLKSLTGYTEKYEVIEIPSNIIDNTTENIPEQTTKKLIEPKIIKVRVTVGGDTVYSETSKHKENETDISVPVSGIGTITIKVYLDEVLGNRTYQMNLNSQDTLIVE